jgi:hypothetical protein
MANNQHVITKLNVEWKWSRLHCICMAHNGGYFRKYYKKKNSHRWSHWPAQVVSIPRPSWGWEKASCGFNKFWSQNLSSMEPKACLRAQARLFEGQALHIVHTASTCAYTTWLHIWVYNLSRTRLKPRRGTKCTWRTINKLWSQNWTLNDNEAGYTCSFAWHIVVSIFDIIIKTKNSHRWPYWLAQGASVPRPSWGWGRASCSLNKSWSQNLSSMEPEACLRAQTKLFEGQAWHNVHTARTRAYNTWLHKWVYNLSRTGLKPRLGTKCIWPTINKLWSQNWTLNENDAGYIA